MTNKIKLFVGFLGLVALFSVFNFFNSFGNSSSTFLKPLTGSVLEAVDQDDDKDGLANREESYWNTDFQNPDTDGDGFKDGEEVTPISFVEKKIINKVPKGGVKILANGELHKKLAISGCAFSSEAKKKIEKSGSTIK